MNDTASTADSTPPPTFDILPLGDSVRRALDEVGYTHPTPVQRAVFEPATKGKDLVVQARTGTGKTAAFGLPIVDVLVKPDLKQPQVLVLCPTRELALQITREVESLAKHKNIQLVAIYGGAPMARQVQQLRDGAQIVIGTPGRVLDHLSRGTFDTSRIRAFVLDESDEMLSMGFLPQITEIWSLLPKGHQTLLFSATLPPDVQRIAETRLKDPEFITLSGDHIGALEIQHLVYVSHGDKLSNLLKVLEIENPESAIVFCNTRDETKKVAAALKAEGFAADWLNADLAQNDREKVMARTRSSDVRFLVATDVAARGIDISHLTHVINHDFPESAEAYVHRTGRTGRAGRTGVAISLIAPGDIGHLYMLRLTYKIFPIERTLPSAREVKSREETDVVNLFVEAFATKKPHADDLALARRLLSHVSAEVVVAGLLRDHLGARPEAVEEAKAMRRAEPPRAAQAPSVVTNGASKPQRDRPESPRKEVAARDAAPRNSAPRDAAPRDAAPRDAAPRDAAPRDAAPRDAAPRDAAPRDAAPREPARRDSVPRDSAPRDTGRRDAAPRDSARRDSAPRDAGRRDMAPRDAAPRDTARRDSAPRDSAPRDSAPRDAAPRDAAPRDAAPRDSAPRDAAPRDAAPRDTGRRDSAPRDSARRDSAPRDAAPRDSAPRDSARRDSAPRDARDAASRDTGPRDAGRKGSAPRDSAPRDAAPRDAAATDSGARDGDVPRDRQSSRRQQGERSTNARAGSPEQQEPNLERGRPRHVPEESRSEFGATDHVRESEQGGESGGEIFVNVGRQDGAKPSDFQGILEDQGFEIDEIDYVRVRQRHTFVGVSEELLRRALNALDGAEIAGRKAMAERARPRGN